jgi:hypothetical protein
MSWSSEWVFKRFVGYWKMFVERYVYPLCIEKWTAFLSNEVLFWKQLGLFPELGSAAPYPWVRFEPNVSYE